MDQYLRVSLYIATVQYFVIRPSQGHRLPVRYRRAQVLSYRRLLTNPDHKARTSGIRSQPAAT